MLTAGVDLAAESKGTALAVVEWGSSSAIVHALDVGVDDEQIVAAAADTSKIGIDCAFGWPDEFVRFVAAHSRRERNPSGPEGGMSWRRTLAFRETDRVVREKTGRWPLSVSTDRLGLTAMRCAGLLERLGDSGLSVDRAGSGAVVEVYPGATLRLWGLDTTGYRTDPSSRRRLLRDLQAAAPWFDVAGSATQMVASGDAFDAVVASLASRSAALGLYDPPPQESRERAQREGWIALPTRPLGELWREGPMSGDAL